MEIFEISIFLVLHFFLVGPSFNHTSANFENKSKCIFWMFEEAYVTRDNSVEGEGCESKITETSVDLA